MAAPRPGSLRPEGSMAARASPGAQKYMPATQRASSSVRSSKRGSSSIRRVMRFICSRGREHSSDSPTTKPVASRLPKGAATLSPKEAGLSGSLR